MCGLAVSIGGRENSLRPMQAAIEALQCRGPDSRGLEVLGDATLGHTRLSIIGMGPAGAQPSVDGRSALVYNGEIYNYRQLSDELGIDAKSDVEVLHEICRQGVRNWIHRIRGMYAFVYFSPNDGELIAARDPFGIKPLYFADDGAHGLHFASTVAGMQSIRRTSMIDRDSLVSFLACGLPISGRTLLEGISKLPPGEAWTWKRRSDGWSLESRDATPLGSWPALPTPEALADSISAHLVADVEVGVLLSGGVDSTLIAALATREVGSIRTYTLTNPATPQIDEAALAAANGRLLGSQHVEVPVSPEELSRQALLLIQSSGEPFGDAAFLPLSLLSERVSQDLKVVLAGEGADELFGGYRRYDAERILNSRAGGWAFGPLARAVGLNERFAGQRSPLLRTLGAAALATPEERHAYLMHHRWREVRSCFGQAATPAWKSFEADWLGTPQDDWNFNLPPARRYDLRIWLPNVYLEKSDRAAMAHGLEVRTPFLDPIAALAASRSLPRDSAKSPLRDLLYEVLPGVHLPKRKRGLAVDMKVLTSGPLRSPLRAALSGSDSVIQELKPARTTMLETLATSDASFAFRLSMIGLWQEVWQ